MSREVGCWLVAGIHVYVSVLRTPSSLSAIASAICVPLVSCIVENHSWSCAFISPSSNQSFSRILLMSGIYPVVSFCVKSRYVVFEF